MFQSAIVALTLAFFTQQIAAATYCDNSRGQCSCDCAWANQNSCKVDDYSCCFSCCCGSTPTPTPKLQLFCPGSSDLTAAYGSPSIFDQGWSIKGGAAVATKSTFNLLGGYVEYDVDFSGVQTGVNANVYSISPYISSSGFSQNNYCDGAATGSSFCLEVDYIESNGNCGGQTTLHTIEGKNGYGCNANGCAASYHYNGRPSFHVKVAFGNDGTWTTTRDGQNIYGSSMNPTPGSSDWSTIASYYSSRGAAIYSSQWTGWVPVSDCGTYGDLYSSHFTVSNVKIYGAVVQGPTPRTCQNSLNVSSV